MTTNNQSTTRVAWACGTVPLASPRTCPPERPVLSGKACIGDQEELWSIWNGQLLGHNFALDTETTLIEGHHVPNLAMMSVSDGDQHYIVRPDDIARFLVHHLRRRTLSVTT